jgi:hypothetical protein
LAITAIVPSGLPSQGADRRDALLAGERELGRRHRVAQPARLLRDRQRIAADEHRRDDERDPDPQHQVGREDEGRRPPRQRVVHEGQQRDPDDRQRRQRDHRPARQRRRRHRHRRQHQDRERVFEAAGQVEQDGELQRVVGEVERGGGLAEPGASAMVEQRAEIEQHRAADDDKRRQQRQTEAEEEMHGQDGHRLSGDRHRADQHQPPETDPVEGSARPRRRGGVYGHWTSTS